MSNRPVRAPWRLVLPLICGAAVVGFGLGFFAVRLAKPPEVAGAIPSASSQAAAAAPGTGGQPAALADAGTVEGADAQAARATDAAPDAATTAADAGPADAAAAVAPGDIEWSDAGLGRFQAYLYVRSNAKADVWVQGVKIGQTNELIKLACTDGHRFTRLGRDPGPAWISETVFPKIPCGQLTVVDLSPRPDAP
ncbi:MAG: hypothetical protein KIT72_13085 [Polyangiaceae bacterium]|nr:hypothetical protein [Polyangiaceae bacterium]MCW5791345.1 hypothetical protein [Polyangiaceae bacterium]